MQGQGHKRKGNGRAETPIAGGRDEVLEAPDKLVPPAHDGMGHTAPLRSTAPPAIKKIIESLVQSGKYPWETEADVVRFFVYEGLKAMSEIDADPDLTEQHKMIKGWRKVIGKYQEHLSFARALEEAIIVVDGLRRDGAVGKARDMLLDLRASVGAMGDRYWKEQYRRVVARKLQEVGR